MREEKENRKRSRDEEKGKYLDAMMDDMADIKKVMKNKSDATIITKALKAIDDEEAKQKLRYKLVQLVLEIER